MELDLPSTTVEQWIITAASLACIFFVYLFIGSTSEGAVDYDVPTPKECSKDFLEKASLIEKPSIKVSGSHVVQCYCPANGKLLAHVNPWTAEGIDRAVEKAAQAQVAWAKTSFAERKRVLRTLHKFIINHQDEIVRVACLDSGKTRVDASFGEMLTTAEKIRWTLRNGEQALKTESRPGNLLMCYKHNEVRYEPLGVVAACVSWNYPFHNVLNPVISALFTGNAILVKGSEQTAWSGQYYQSVVQGALKACGHSPYLVQIFTCWPDVAPHLTSHPGIEHITFVGSRNVAHHVASSASKSLASLCVELGGKDASIVLDDVSDLKTVSSVLMRGVFQSAGQNCIGIERVVALPKVYEKLKAMIPSRVQSLRVGSALDSEEEVDMGSCISDVGFDRLEGLIKDAVARGAELLCGGSRLRHPVYPLGHYFQPTFLAGVTPDMPIAQEELFAPIFVLMKAVDVDDAIRITNSTMYGLGCSVFGRSPGDLEKVTKQVKVGMVSVNDFGVYYVTGLPFGGAKGSGYGRFGGAEGLRSLCNLKAVTTDRAGWLMSTSIPPGLDYPTAEAQTRAAELLANGRKGPKAKAWDFCCGVVETGNSLTFAGMIGGVLKLIKNG